MMENPQAEACATLGLYRNVVIRDGVALAADGIDAQNFETPATQVRNIFLHRLMKVVFEFRCSGWSRQEPRIDAVGGDLAGRHGTQLYESRSGRWADGRLVSVVNDERREEDKQHNPDYREVILPGSPLVGP